ncbi:MAG TPA: lipopolysaccharide biosynthesis protein, partial [Ginsengibacter sp.]|nr:lipopolysaccharide biosynthesis protein [Ginsengibacter sp.]
MNSVRTSVLWDYAGNLSSQLISFVISVVLARMLGPEEFGLIALAMVVISMATIFATMGFGASIINAKELDPRAVNTIFIVNVGIGLLLTFLCILFAPAIARFYQNEQLESVLQVLSVIFIFSTAQAVHQALLTRDMKFRQLAKRQVLSSTLGGIVGIVMAYRGMGVWSLVGQALVSNFCNVVFYWYISTWRPSFLFSVHAIKPYWEYSNKLFLSSILDNVYSRFDVIFFGKIFSLALVGNFNRARSFTQLIIRNSSQSIMKVLFPYLSKLQGNLEQMRKTSVKALHIICFLVFGLIAVFASCGQDLILFLYSEKWKDAIPIFYWLILGSFAYPLSALLVNIIRGNGNSRLFLNLEIVKKVIACIPFYFGWRFGIIAFVQILLVTQTINIVISIYAASSEIKLSALLQMKIILLYAVSS